MIPVGVAFTLKDNANALTYHGAFRLVIYINMSMQGAHYFKILQPIKDMNKFSAIAPSAQRLTVLF